MSLRFLGWYHIVGAAAGLGVMLWAWTHQANLPGGSLVFALIPFAACASAGGYLVRGDRRGFNLAVIVQALQIPIVVLPIVTWKFIAGVIAAVTVSVPTGLYIYTGIEGTWLIGWHSRDPMPATIGINVAPLIVLALLLRSRLAIGRRFRDAVEAPAV